MAYADYKYYSETYIGREAAQAVVEKYLSKASDDIDLFCAYAIVSADLTDFQKDLLSRAACAQAEDYIARGDGLDDFDSLSLGSVSISGGAKKGSGLSNRAIEFLTYAGLGSRGIMCGRYRV